jgi:hypothetical protein
LIAMSLKPDDKGQHLVLLGLTSTGQVFRPSDWAERLCGVLSHYRPPGRCSTQQHLAYSPYAQPTTLNGVKCVAVDTRLSDLEPMAMKFVMNFARDNDLQIRQACLLPDTPAQEATSLLPN